MPDALAHFQAGHARHFNVQKYQVRALPHKYVYGLEAVSGLHYYHVIRFQTLACQESNILVIVADKNFSLVMSVIVAGHLWPG